MKKRMLSLFLAMALLVCLLPVSAWAVTVVSNVEVVNLIEPMDGNVANTFPDVKSNAYSIYSVEWYNVTDDEFLVYGDKHEAGKVYRANVWVEVNSGYEFKYIDSRTPDVTATINGKTATVHKAYEYNAWAMVVVSYTFEPCPKKEIYSVDIELGHLEEYYSVPFKINNPMHQLQPYTTFHPDFYSGGIKWKNYSLGKTVYEGDRFVGGYDYTVSIALMPKYSGWTIAEDFTATINGKKATVTINGGDYVVIGAEFTCYGSIYASNITPTVMLPVGGNAPDFSIFYDSCENIDYACVRDWYDEQTGKALTHDDIFQAGKRYRVEVELMADYAYKFARDENDKMTYTPTITGCEVDSYSFTQDYRGREVIILSKTFVASGEEEETPDYNGLVEVDGVWGYYKDGILQTDYTGLVEYNEILFYVENGILDFTYTGLVWHNDAWTYVANSQLTEGYTGLVWFEGEWFYTVDSIIDWTFTGLVPYEGNMFYVQNNHLDWGYTGLAYLNDGWYYVENALLKPDFTGLTYFNDNWFYVVDGTIDWTFTGMVSYNGNLFYVQNNLLDWSYTGIGYHDGGWYYFQNALYTTTFTGLVPFNGSLFYVKDGAIDWSFNGEAEYDGVTYTVIDGAVIL